MGDCESLWGLRSTAVHFGRYGTTSGGLGTVKKIVEHCGRVRVHCGRLGALWGLRGTAVHFSGEPLQGA